MKLRIALLAFSLLLVTESPESVGQTLLPRLPLVNGPLQNSTPVQPSSTPGSYYQHIIARGNDREVLQNMPVEMRPNRPFHFYGNMVRRSYHGQSPIAPLRR